MTLGNLAWFITGFISCFCLCILYSVMLLSGKIAEEERKRNQD